MLKFSLQNFLQSFESLFLICERLPIYGDLSLSKWRVTVSGELMFLETYSNCDVANTVTLLL